MEKLGVALIVCIFVISILLMGGVVAEVNYALSGTASRANPQAGANNYLVWRVNDAALNDNSEAGVAHGAEISNQAIFQTWGNWDSMIDFPSPVSQLDRIEVVAGKGTSVWNVIRIMAYVDSGAGWQQVGNTGDIDLGVSPATRYTYTFTTGAPWNNVNRIKVNTYAVCAPNHYVDYNVYEVRAWGPDACVYEGDVAFCSGLGMDCGTVASDTDNCGDVRTNVDCGGCSGGESCDDGACVAEEEEEEGCDDYQTIMRLYQGDNSHVSFWDESVADYTEEICYDAIFGSPYVGANPHDCTGNNRVLSLYDTSNSHASNVSDVNYDDDVCFGNLECVYEADSAWSDGCNNGGKVVARLYSGTNSHVSNASGVNYFNRICCVFPEIYWADANGVKITKADEVNIGDTIQAVMTNIASGIFNISELTLVDNNFLNIVGQNINGNLIGEWTITQVHLDAAGGLDRFVFEVDGSGDFSDEINISDIYNDSEMDITIVSPNCGDNYSKGGEVEIIVSASDEDDFLEGNVSINGVVVETFVNGGVTFNYTFVLDGNFQIVAEAVNSRGKRARHIANIMIVDLVKDGSYVAACIDKPKDFIDIEEAEVTFDASTTRAIAVSGGLAKPFSPEVYPTNFSWYWTFFMPEIVIREPFVNSDNPRAYYFNVTFPVAGQNSASLRVEFE